MRRMRISTRLLPGVWLSQPISCCSCLAALGILMCGGLFGLSLVLAGLDSLTRLVPPIIQMWGR